MDLVCWSKVGETRQETSRTVPPTGNVQSQDFTSFIVLEVNVKANLNDFQVNVEKTTDQDPELVVIECPEGSNEF